MSPTSLNRPIFEIGCIYNFLFCICVVDGGHFPKSTVLSTSLGRTFFCLAFLFQMKIFCSDWPYLIRNHLSFLFLCFVLKYLH